MMETAGNGVMVIVAVPVTAAHDAPAGMVYVTVYVPAVLSEGLMAPVEAFRLRPAGEEVYVPPVKVPVPDKFTFWEVVCDVQNGVPGYEIPAVGN
jgi:hypothetical protein